VFEKNINKIENRTND